MTNEARPTTSCAIDAGRIAPPVPVTYRTATGEERSDHLLGLVWLPADRWVWAVNGWPNTVIFYGKDSELTGVFPSVALRAECV
jgi:hypothetical protein